MRQAIAVLIKEYQPQEDIFTRGLQFLSSKDQAEIYMALVPGAMRDAWLRKSCNLENSIDDHE